MTTTTKTASALLFATMLRLFLLLLLLACCREATAADVTKTQLSADSVVVVESKNVDNDDALALRRLASRYFNKKNDQGVSEERDAVLPVSSLSEHRSLQQGLDTLQCAPQGTDGTLQTCVWDDAPQPGLVTVFQSCPTNTGTASIIDCQICVVVMQDNVDQLSLNDPTCSSCTLCPSTNTFAFDCTNLFAGQCTAVDCDGNCVGPPPAPTESPAPTPPPTEAPLTDLQCVRQPADGSLACYSLNTPRNGFLTTLFGCVANTTIQECSGCITYEETDITSVVAGTTPECESCGICSSTRNVQTDCSNLLVDDSCAVTTCEGGCLLGPTGAPTVTASPTTSPAPTRAPTMPMPTVAPGPTSGSGRFFKVDLVFMAVVLLLLTTTMS